MPRKIALALSEAVSLRCHLRRPPSPWGVPSGLILPKQRQAPPAISVDLFCKIKLSAFNSPLPVLIPIGISNPVTFRKPTLELGDGSHVTCISVWDQKNMRLWKLPGSGALGSGTRRLCSSWTTPMRPCALSPQGLLAVSPPQKQRQASLLRDPTPPRLQSHTQLVFPSGAPGLLPKEEAKPSGELTSSAPGPGWALYWPSMRDKPYFMETQASARDRLSDTYQPGGPRREARDQGGSTKVQDQIGGMRRLPQAEDAKAGSCRNGRCWPS